jgi:thiamine-monophosphate kinase
LSKVTDLGERRIIEVIIKRLDKFPKMAVPFGDDVTALSIDNSLLAVLKTDMLVAKTDIPPGMSLQQAARKAVIMNISDLAAKGVKPIAFLTSLGLTRDLTEDNIIEIANGLNIGAREYDTYIIGGDTGETSDLVICGMVFGLSKPENLITRSGAKPGDVLAVTGLFGKTASGMKILLEGFKAPPKLRKSLLEAVYMPRARLQEGLSLAKARVATASIDSSDGLAVSLHELRKMSKVGFCITNMPIAPEAVQFAGLTGLKSNELALYGGEEYEIVTTIRRNDWKKAQQAVRGSGGNLMSIGEVIKEEKVVFLNDDREEIIPYRGWEHFKGDL